MDSLLSMLLLPKARVTGLLRCRMHGATLLRGMRLLVDDLFGQLHQLFGKLHVVRFVAAWLGNLGWRNCELC